MTFWPSNTSAKLRPLKHLARFNPEVLSEDTDPDFEFDYIDIGGVTLEEGVHHKEPTRFEAAPSRARKPVRTGDVIVSTVRTYLKAVARIDEAHNGAVVSTGFAVLRPNAGVDAGYLYRLCQANPFVGDVQAQSTGVSYPAINPSALAAIKVPLPDLDTQKAIAAHLDRETARIDQLIAKKERQVAVLDEQRAAIIREHVRIGVTPSSEGTATGNPWFPVVPKGWRPHRMRHLFRFTKRQGMPELDVLSVYREFGVILKSSRDDNINKTPEDLSSYQLVEPGDLVINKMKAWQGSLGISQIRGITSPDYLVYKPISSMVGRFMHHFLRAQPMPSLYLTISNGIRTDQWRLEHAKFMDVVVWLPKLDEQVQISNAIDSRIGTAERLIDAVASSIALLRDRRAALITAAVTGQLDIREKLPAVATKPDRATWRVIVGAEIIHRLPDNPKRARVKVHKLTYLAEAHLGIDGLQGNYLREAAGPLDRALREETERGLEAAGYFRANQTDGTGTAVTYTPLARAGQHKAELEALLGPKVDDLRKFIAPFADLDRRQTEAVATLYAVWNDALIDGQTLDDAGIINGVLNDWHTEKGDKFTKADLTHWLAWMRRHNLIPRGQGPRTTTGRLFV
jgi:type I restriction enzyme S subunit